MENITIEELKNKLDYSEAFGVYMSKKYEKLAREYQEALDKIERLKKYNKELSKTVEAREKLIEEKNKTIKEYKTGTKLDERVQKLKREIVKYKHRNNELKNAVSSLIAEKNKKE